MKLNFTGLASGLAFAFLFCVALVAGTEKASAQPPAGFNDVVSMGGWNAPQGAVWDANDRMYVWEKAGRVWIVENGVKLATPLIDISPEVGDWRDHGCLGFALDPNFLVNGHIYLMYMVDRHHLMNFGIPGGTYFTGVNTYYSATIMRITRYTAIGPTFNTVNPASRLILVGETKKTGVAELHESHSTGTLLFGTDGTLLATVGDGASYNSTDVGSASETYYIQALADSIIRPEENVGALRAQMVNSHNGKLLRIDPATGNGVPSNPFYDPLNPRAPKSRLWAMGLRNPFRTAIRPGSGSIDPAAGDPGTIYIGDVGWDQWEELNVCYEGGMNFGWPLYEGLEAHSGYQNAAGKNFDAPNPLYNGTSCTADFFNFKDLLKQDTPIHLNGHPNPCDGSQQIPNTVPHFFHSRPAIDWEHGGSNRARTGIFTGGVAATINLNAIGSPVPGPLFGGFASIGGTWLSGTGWPAGYQNVYFHGDYPGAWIRKFTFDGQDAPTSVTNFGSNMGAVIWMGEGPEGCLYYVRYDSNELRRICYGQSVNLPPVAVASQDVQYGPGPLNVQFNGAGSYDPENSAITYLWNFGDGQTSTAQNPVHLFSPNPNVLTSYTVTLTVTDANLQTNQTSLLVSVNNTPPNVDINSFLNGSYYPWGIDTTYVLSAAVSDLEHGPGQLSYSWRTILHHNTHSHPEPANAAPVTSTLISGVGCDGQDYFYEIKLTVTDAGGLATTDVNFIYPRCYAIPPTALISANVSFGTGPLNVQFDGSTSYDPGSIVGYAWDFGDGGTATGPTPAHNFTATGEHYVTLTVTDNDGLTGTAQRLITVLTLDPPQCVGALGSIRRDFWSGISGSAVINLTSSPNYPDNPTSTTFPTTFQAPANIANSYGTRMHGYIIAPETGIYHFTITSDDASVLYLSPNAEPAFKQFTCEIPGSTGNTEYTKYPTQRSGNIQMQAGAYYYVEMIQKEGSGSDHMTLRWERPSNPTLTIVPGANLARWQDCPPSVNLRANLQGAYDSQANLMRDALRTSSLIPATEPFTALGYTHVGGGGGETVPGSLLTVTGANACVDWVLVEIRNKNNPAVIVATRSALLQRDGDIVGTNGYPRLLFSGLAADNYYIAVRHRNHFGTMTFASTLLNKNQKLVDLTLSSTATYGTDGRAVLSNGKRALWAGNVIPDASLKYAGSSNDRDPILVAIGGVVPTATVNGYLPTDVTLDGVVKYAGSGNDRDPILLNIGGSVPTATRAQQLP